MENAVEKESPCRLDSGSYPASYHFSFPTADCMDIASAEVLLTTCNLGACKHIAWLCSKPCLLDVLDSFSLPLKSRGR